ncbi:MAG: protein kinase [Myxococcaceae bacterium]
MFDDLEKGTVVGGKYRIEGVLGTGGMGSVYQATNASIGRRVAIKLLDAKLAKQTDFLHRFQMEAKASAMIGHPNIVDVLDMGEMDDGSPFIVMEYLEGVTLKSLQKKLGSLSPGEVVAVVGPVLDALSAAHAAGVIHRDLKPANIFISLKPVPAVKILDFGISKFSTGSSAGITQTGMSMGTPAYMAPEQVRGEKQIGPEADLYSMGAILYYLLSGHPPFEGESNLAVVARVLTDQHRSLSQERPDLPAKLTQLVDRLLTKAKEQRPKDASLVKRALETICAPDMESVIKGAKGAYRSNSLTGLRAQEPDAPTTPTTPTGGRKATGEVRERTKASRPQIKATPAPIEEIADEAPASSKAPLIAGVAALVLLGGAATWFFLSRNEPVVPQKPVKMVEEIPLEKPKEPEKHVEAVKPAEKVTLKVQGEPKAVHFSLDGKALDCNPCELPGNAGTKAQLEASAEGYVSKTVELSFDQSREVPVQLAADPKKVATQNVGRKPQTPDPKEKKKGGLSIDESNPYAK